jgi:hypothetical protein
VATRDNGVTPSYPISDPFPNGFTPAPGNMPRDQAQAALVGGSLSSMPLKKVPSYPYQSQWNIAVQRQLWGDVALEVAYAGNRGVHLPSGTYGTWQINALPVRYLSLGSGLNSQVTNPFYGLVKTGTLSQPTVTRGQLPRPFPQYTGVAIGEAYIGDSSYHALQMKGEKRFSNGGTILVAYTFSKLLGNTGSLTEWLDSGLGSGASYQDPANLRAEKALLGFDSRQRLTVGYTADLPIGKGRRFLNGGNSVAQKFSSGWSVSGMSTFQMGFPLALTATPNNASSFGLGLRPNVRAGCNPKISGSAQSRLTGWFNVSCYSVPAPYTLGNESATDPVLRGHGINNFDFSLLKKTAIPERFTLEFRGEIYNLFNRVQFGLPNTQVTTAANPTTGYVTRQINQPRLIQLALRLLF